jgi:hypothetical protein
VSHSIIATEWIWSADRIQPVRQFNIAITAKASMSGSAWHAGGQMFCKPGTKQPQPGAETTRTTLSKFGARPTKNNGLTR